jgi:hypothetical protein
LEEKSVQIFMAYLAIRVWVESDEVTKMSPTFWYEVLGLPEDLSCGPKTSSGATL